MKIFKILIAIILLLSFVLVGTPIKYNCSEFSIAIILIGSIFAIYKLVFKKEKIILDKIDIVVLILQLSPLIPLIFGTYASLEETLMAIIRNVSLFNIYFILKHLTFKKSNNKEYITSILIIGGLVLALLGIDEMLSKEVFRYMRFIGIPNIINYEGRMFSTIGYANTFAVIMAAEIMLCLEMLKKRRLVCSGLIYIFLLAMLLSYSRSVIAMFAVLLIIYYIFSKKNRIYSMYVVFSNLVLAVFGMKLFEAFSTNKQYLAAWLSVVAFVVLSALIALLICKLYKRVCKIKIKTYIWIAIVGVILIGIMFVVGMQLTIPLKLFENDSDNEEVRYKLSRVDKSTPYTFELDIASYTKNGNDSNYTIEIVEENKYYDVITTHEIEFGDYVGKKEISFTTSDETVAMVIYFKSASKKVQNSFTINSLYVNGKEVGLNYLYIPMRLVERIDSFSINSKSLWERLVYYVDGMKIIKEHWLFGTGTKGWIYNFTKVQSYVYSATEVHSYPLQLVIENGILSLVCYATVIVYVIVKIIKAKKLTGVDMAFILLNLHSAVDFNMSFYVVLIMWITLLGLTTKKGNNCLKSEKNLTKNIKHIKYILQYLVVVLNIATIVLGIYTCNLSENTEATIKQINKLIRKDDYNAAVQLMQQIDEDKQGMSTVYGLLSRLEYENLTDENLEYVTNIILEQDIIPSTGYNMAKNEMMERIIREISNSDITIKLANLVVSENDKMIQNITNVEVNRLSKDSVERYLQRQQDIYELSCEILKVNEKRK